MSYTQDDFNRYFNSGDAITINGVVGSFAEASSDAVRINAASARSFAYEDIVQVPELDEKMQAFAKVIEGLLDAGAVKLPREQWASLTTAAGPMLVEYKTRSGDYILMYGAVEADSPNGVDRLILHIDAQATARYEALKARHDPDATWGLFDGQHCFAQLIGAIYQLDSVSNALADVSMEKLAVPYRITLERDGFLPDMQDFSLERAGSVDQGWLSTCPIKGGRELACDEKLSACLVERATGHLTRFEYTAQNGKLGAAQWPKAFAEFIAKTGGGITAGAWSEDGTFSTQAAPLRVWSRTGHRAFTTAPFANNLVQALACNDEYRLPEGQALCLQVRDLKTQALHEHHVFTPTAAQSGEGWGKALCEQINRDSQLVRAGVRDEGCNVAPGQNGNAFWVPQCAELAVTLTEVNWWASRQVDGSVALGEGQGVHVWVYDAFSKKLLAEHEWTPGEGQRSSGQWLEAWSEALGASPVSAYLRVDELTLWHRGDALRIFTTLPDKANKVAGPSLESVFKKTSDAVLVTVRHASGGQVLHQGLFRPQDAKKVSDRAAWLSALAAFINGKQWPEVWIDRATQVGVPRFSELSVELENLGDGTWWSAEHYDKHLSEDEDTGALEWESGLDLSKGGAIRLTGDFTEVSCAAVVQTWAYDLYSNQLLAMHEWKPNQDNCAKDKWLQAWGAALNTSAMSPFLRAAVSNPGASGETELSAETMTLWYRGHAVRIYASFPSLQERDTPVVKAGPSRPPADRYLLNAVRVAGGKPRAAAEFTLDATQGRMAVCVQALNGELELRLTPQATQQGYRIAACLPRNRNDLSKSYPSWPVEVTSDKVTWRGPVADCIYDVVLDYPDNLRGSAASTIAQIGAFSDTRFWHEPKAVTFTPAPALTLYKPTSFLCEDFGNTQGSEVFDTQGFTESGVDPHTGLFHAHYPLATLQGLRGLGPVCDLSLHYSALRANEGGLGDGWAWRFSGLLIRDRKLTLADGTQEVFNEKDWKRLGEGETLVRKHYSVRCKDKYGTFIIDWPVVAKRF